MYKIVITGAPCTGKTEFVHWLCKKCDNIYCIPEVGSIVKEMGFPFNSAEERLNFECKIYDFQILLENWMRVHLINKDAILLCDRGTLDVFAYCDLGNVISINSQLECERYNAVLHFRCATSQESYEKFRYKNLFRDENYERALELDKKLANLWKTHPAYYEFAWENDKYNKYENAFGIISRMLKITERQEEV